MADDKATREKYGRTGRPSKNDAKTIGAILGALRTGATTEAACAKGAGISIRSLQRWILADEELADAVDAARAVADAEVEDTVFRSATGQIRVKEQAIAQRSGEKVTLEKQLPPNMTAAIFWLKNRKPEIWRDRHELVQSGPVRVVFEEAEPGAEPGAEAEPGEPSRP